MKFFIRFLVSLDRLWRDPGAWWSHQHWLTRLSLSLSLVPAISVISIGFYQAHQGLSSEQLVTIRTQEYQELIALKKQLFELEDQQKKLTSLLEATLDPNRSSQVLGADSSLTPDTNTPTQLNSRLISDLESAQNNTATKIATLAKSKTANVKMVFLPTGNSPTTELYAEPRTNSLVLTTIPTNTWYVLVTKQEGWYQLELDDPKQALNQSTGWVPAAVVQELP